jgi:hypothetical protein
MRAKEIHHEMRMIVNNSYPHPDTPMYTTVGRREPVISLNDSRGAQFDRERRRDEAEQQALQATGVAPTPTRPPPRRFGMQAHAGRPAAERARRSCLLSSSRSSSSFS